MSKQIEYKTRVKYNSEWHSVRMMPRDMELVTVIDVIIDDKERHTFMRHEDVPESLMMWTQDSGGESELSKVLTPELDRIARENYEASVQDGDTEHKDDLDF